MHNNQQLRHHMLQLRKNPAGYHSHILMSEAKEHTIERVGAQWLHTHLQSLWCEGDNLNVCGFPANSR